VEIPDPTPEEFRAIFARVCEEKGIAFQDEAVDYLFAQWYKPYERQLRGCHPRDFVEAIVDSARYSESGQPVVTPKSLDEVCHTYFLTD
jgi:hypothetical protein